MIWSVLSSAWLRVPLLCLGVVVVQTGFVASLQLFDASPDLVILLVVTTALVGGPLAGAVVGFVSGLLEDALMTTPFALWALTLCLTGYVVGLLRREALVESTAYQVIVASVASAAAVVLFAVLATVFGREGLLTFDLVPIAVVVSATTAVLYLPAKRAVRWALPTGRERAERAP